MAASKLFRIKRNWSRQPIVVDCYDPDSQDSAIEEIKGEPIQAVRAGYTKEIVYVETPIEDFEERLVELALSMIQDKPMEWEKLRWCFRQKTITEEVRKILHEQMHTIIREALRTQVKEMKKVINKIW